jgi:hypothetical protein
VTAHATDWERVLDEYEQALQTLRELATADEPTFDFAFEAPTEPLPESFAERANKLLALSVAIEAELAEAMAEIERQQSLLTRPTSAADAGQPMFVDARA